MHHAPCVVTTRGLLTFRQGGRQGGLRHKIVPEMLGIHDRHQTVQTGHRRTWHPKRCISRSVPHHPAGICRADARCLAATGSHRGRIAPDHRYLWLDPGDQPARPSRGDGRLPGSCLSRHPLLRSYQKSEACKNTFIIIVFYYLYFGYTACGIQHRAMHNRQPTPAHYERSARSPGQLARPRRQRGPCHPLRLVPHLRHSL